MTDFEQHIGAAGQTPDGPSQIAGADGRLVFEPAKVVGGRVIPNRVTDAQREIIVRLSMEPGAGISRTQRRGSSRGRRG